MIRVVKPAQPPLILRKKGVATRDRHCSDYDAAPGDHDLGTRSIETDSKIYNAKSVKNALVKAQHQKCCYCEAKPLHVAFGDVEHFRPKAGFQQKRGDPLGKPGYYWLAYEWSNLFMACAVCNQQFKKNLFPLKNPVRRARSHHDDVSHERPQLIDPAVQDPERFIKFRAEYPVPIDGNAIGRTTIDVLKLDERPPLIEARRELLTWIKLALEHRDLLKATISDTGASPLLINQLTKIEHWLEGCVGNSAEFAAMARAALGVASGARRQA